jgi:Na+-driven multidrug efflux pump
VQKYGAVVLNGAGIASNISNLCFLLPSSYGAAVTTLVSMNIGAGNELRARRTCFAGSVISAITATVMIAVIVPLTPRLTILFTRQQAVLDVANNALNIYLYAVIGFGISMVLQGAFIGLGRTRITVVISLLRVWLLRYFFILLTEKYLGFNAVFWGSLFSNYMTMLITIAMILKVRWVSVIPDRRGTPDTSADNPG